MCLHNYIQYENVMLKDSEVYSITHCVLLLKKLSREKLWIWHSITTLHTECYRQIINQV